MDFTFKNLTFRIYDERIYLIGFGDMLYGFEGEKLVLYSFAEVQVAGEIRYPQLANKMTFTSEGNRLKYFAHSIDKDTLTVVQKSEVVEVTTTFVSFCDTSTIRVNTSVKNIANEPIVLEEVSAINLTGFGRKGVDSYKDLEFYKFYQSHKAECQPKKLSFEDYGLYKVKEDTFKKISCANRGSWSTKEELPQGIIVDNSSSRALMFQIECNNSWYYEISDKVFRYYLSLGSASLTNCFWSKILAPNEEYSTVWVSIAVADSVESVISEMTKYRRHICGKCIPDESLPTIFNEYMHLSWDSPNEERTKRVAKAVAELGVDYYVIDCGWHNEEPGEKIYPYVGQWKESKTRFPSGLRKTTDYIRSLGMKAGLWIEPEIVGIECNEMLDYYDDDCFMQRKGKRITSCRRYFLDFRNKKVVDYMNESIRRMVEDYGADYIKMDYNQDCGVGTDLDACEYGEGLEKANIAYFKWIDGLRERFPNVLFESCSSGGMRMDYKTLSHFSIVSTSDQISFYKYPCIASNVLSAVIPEQAAVWSYPVAWTGDVGDEGEIDKAWVKCRITKERVIYNMVNSFLGRLHLASDLTLLDEDKLVLVKEGVDYHNKLAQIKKVALPVFPLGFASIESSFIASGFKYLDKIYLAVWNRSGKRKVLVPIKDRVKMVEITYPLNNLNVSIDTVQDGICVNFTEDIQARFIEITVE